ncbi:MAG TPA: sigma-70 family RNA polymerase sigma factor [Polyangiaceae bacterium]|nr:sigma-70 family RNA polymerase sigma factor [Polyangiaceae bacterium]
MIASSFELDLARAHDTAAEHWPTLAISFERFKAHLSRLGYREQLPKYPSSVYLCAACICEADTACKVFEAAYFPSLQRFISKFDSRIDIIEDLLQQLRTRLFVGSGARIASYQGKGSLQGWLRGVARSIAVDFLRARKTRREDSWCAFDGEVPYNDCSGAAHVSSPEEDYFVERETRGLLAGLRRALGTLDAEERQLMQHYFVSGLTIDALAPLYGVNRSTVARRIQRNLARIRRELRRELLPEFGAIEVADLENCVPLVYQRLEVDACVLLAG